MKGRIGKFAKNCEKLCEGDPLHLFICLPPWYHAIIDSYAKNKKQTIDPGAGSRGDSPPSYFTVVIHSQRLTSIRMSLPILRTPTGRA
jgi:hypothetical protein